MTTKPVDVTELYAFPQPIGLWRRRHAHPVYVQLATGGTTPLAWPKTNAELVADDEGYNVWHYWAQGPSPDTLWQDVRGRIGKKWDLQCAVSGEHPLYRLILRGHVAACVLWTVHADFPRDMVCHDDTLWHALAWNGSEAMLDAVQQHLPLSLINQRDNQGLTAVAIAAHRGGQDSVRKWLLLGADPNIPDEQNKVLLHHVAQYGDIAWYTEVQDMGAADEVKNDRGQTPLDVLKDRKKHATSVDMEMLKSHWEKRFFQKLMF